MSIDSTLASSVHGHSLKHYQNQSYNENRRTSSVEGTSGDLHTDVSSTPYPEINVKRNRRFSELKLTLSGPTQRATSQRRNSITDINFSSFLPHPFRTKKNYQKHTAKDDTNTMTNSLHSMHQNDTTTIMKIEIPSSLKLSTVLTEDLRTNLSRNIDHSSFSSHEDSTSLNLPISSQFIFCSCPYEPRSAETLILELYSPLRIAEIYHEYFYDCFHMNYYGELEQEGLFIASLRYFYTKSTQIHDGSTSLQMNTNCQARAIIRVPNDNYDVSVMINGTKEETILQILFNKAHLSTIRTYKTIGDPKANEKIYLFDKTNDERQNCKIGLIYQCVDQTDELSILSNDTVSNDLSIFLQTIADCVALRGFDKFRGDLDIKNDLHGPYSYYTKYKDYEIMFNVAPMVSSTKSNRQYIERKSLVGNSFVCIVFQEADAEFKPNFISGKVTQIYITVQPMKIDEELYYRIGIWRRSDVTSVIDPPGGIYLSDNSFRDYFLTLLLNSINAAIESPSLHFRVVEQRQRLKQEEFKKLIENLSIEQIFDSSSEIEHIDSNVDQQFHSMSDNVSSIMTLPTNDLKSDHTSSVSTKKRGLSKKILDAFSIRSNFGPLLSPSTSLPLNLPNNNAQIVHTTANKINAVQSGTVQVGNEKFGKRPSPKRYRAPKPPLDDRASIANRQNFIPSYSSIPKIPTTYPLDISNSTDSNNEDQQANNDLLHVLSFDKILRNRSNSSPEERKNTMNKTESINTIRQNQKLDSVNSSIDADEINENEKLEYHHISAESPLVFQLNTNS